MGFFSSSHFISQFLPTRFPLITAIRMCHFLPVHDLEWHFGLGRRSKYYREKPYETIEWFRKIKNKSKATLMQSDIIDFYPSITKNILIDSINYARKYVDVTNEQYEIIFACRKTIIKNNESTWVKSGLDNFDVPMGGGLWFLTNSRPCRFIYIKYTY